MDVEGNFGGDEGTPGRNSMIEAPRSSGRRKQACREEVTAEEMVAEKATKEVGGRGG